MYPSLIEQLSRSMGNGFRLDRELGGGGMSRVFLAEDRELGRLIVVKVLPPELTTAISIERFRREIVIAAGLQHPNIVPVLSAAQSGDLVYYTMPFVAGESLRQRLSRAAADATSRLAIDEILRVLREVSRALAYAHRHGVVHRDIKPENVLLSDDGVLVTDFGIAKAMSMANPGTTALTGVGLAVGTLAYMAPEQATGDPEMDHRVDIYAFGALAYELLAGVPPFAGRASRELMVAHAVAEPAPIASRRADAPRALSDLVMRCLAKLPADRPQSADDLRVTLERASAAFSPRARSWTIAAVMVAATIAIVVGIILVPADTRGVLRTLLLRGSPVLVAHRYVVAPFENHTSNKAFDAFGFEVADWIGQGLARLPGIEVVDARTTMANKRAVERIPWPLRSVGRGRALAEESSAGILITGSIYAEGDLLRLQAHMTNVATGALMQPIQEVIGVARDHQKLILELQDRVVGTVSFISDTGVIARSGSYSNPPSIQAYEELIRGMEAYFGDDTSMYAHLHRAEQLDSAWATPTVFVAYLDGWNARAGDYVRDTLRATRLARNMTPAEHAMSDYTRALGRADLPALLPAALRFMRSTPGSMESPLLVSSTANGLREPLVALAALKRVDPDRGLNLKGGYYWQSLVGADQALFRLDRVLKDAREGARRFPHKILFRVYEARTLATLGKLDRVDAAIARAQLEHHSVEAARVVVAAHAAVALAMTGRASEARELAARWWPVASTMTEDTTRWVQEAVADVALLAERWSDLAAFTSGLRENAGRPYFERLSYAAVGSLHVGDTASARRADSVLAAKHPDLDFGYREIGRARIAAHRGNSAAAVAMLEQAVAEGARLKLLWGLDFLSDPFLLPLRGSPPFTQLLPRKP